MQRTLALLLLVFLPLNALADGKVFPTAIAAHVTLPDQRALIHFTNGMERLVIETRFTGAGTNFAWVVPLPSPPVIEPATAGLFPTLQYLFRPRIVHDVPHFYLGFVAPIGVGYLLTFVRPDRPLNRLDILACLLVGLATSVQDPLLGLVVLALLLVGVLFIRLAKEPALIVFGIVAAALYVVAGRLTPELSHAGGTALSGASTDQAVSLLDRRIVGVFDTTTNVWLNWVPFAEKRSRLFSRVGAWTYALNWATGALAVGLLAGRIFMGRGELQKARWPRWYGGVAGLSVVLLGGVYLAVPKAEVRVARHPGIGAYVKLYQLNDSLAGLHPLTLPKARSHCRDLLANPARFSALLNLTPTKRSWWGNAGNDLLGGTMHEEDSPGNYTLREAGDQLEFLGYDALGAEQFVGTWPAGQERQ